MRRGGEGEEDEEEVKPWEPDLGNLRGKAWEADLGNLRGVLAGEISYVGKLGNPVWATCVRKLGKPIWGTSLRCSGGG